MGRGQPTAATPLFWSQIGGPPAERVWKRALVDFGAFDLDERSDAPAYEPHPDDAKPGYTERIVANVGRVFATEHRDDITAQAVEAEKIRAARPDYVALSDRELVAFQRERMKQYEAFLYTHLSLVYEGSLVTGMLEQTLAPLGDPTLTARVIGGRGNIASAAPSVSLWRLSRLVTGSAPLTAAFDAGVEGGARPDPHPHIPLGLLERMRLQPDERDPRRQSKRLQAEREAVTAQLRDQLAGKPEALARRQLRLPRAAERSAALSRPGTGPPDRSPPRPSRGPSMTRTTTAALLLVLVFTAQGCGGDEGRSAVVNAPPSPAAEPAADLPRLNRLLPTYDFTPTADPDELRDKVDVVVDGVVSGFAAGRRVGAPGEKPRDEHVVLTLTPVTFYKAPKGPAPEVIHLELTRPGDVPVAVYEPIIPIGTRLLLFGSARPEESKEPVTDQFAGRAKGSPLYGEAPQGFCMAVRETPTDAVRVYPGCRWPGINSFDEITATLA